jgi:hypothetical protein
MVLAVLLGAQQGQWDLEFSPMGGLRAMLLRTDVGANGGWLSLKAKRKRKSFCAR